MDPTKTLKSILGMISKDVRQIKKAHKDIAMEPETALTLTRYASTLSHIIEERNQAREKTKLRYQTLPTEELVNMYLKNKKKEKVK